MVLVLQLLLLCTVVGSISPVHRRVKRIVGGHPADEPPPESAEVSSTPTSAPTTTSNAPKTTPSVAGDEPIVFVRRRRRSAKVTGKREDGFYAFLGLRYAEPPVRRLRFQRPKKFKLRGDIDATKPGAPCLQPLPNNKGITGSEDCLFLNVYTPKIPEGPEWRNPSLPVLLWIHGGGFRRGSASQYGGRHLVNKNIILVTIQYRLGSLGFLSSGQKELPGNVGLFDMAAAIKWVHDYIQFFGGNPRRITSSGQGCGASSAAMLSSSRVSRSMVGGVFAMSGTPVSSFAVDKDQARTAGQVAQHDGCQNTTGLQFVRCMQEVSPEAIINGDNDVQFEKTTEKGFVSGLAGVLGPSPAVEGMDDGRFLFHFLPQAPLDTLQAGQLGAIPLLTGVTKEETSTGIKGNFITEILNKLKSVPQFLEQSLTKNLLHANTGLFNNGTVNGLLSSLFSNNGYLKGITKSLNSASSDLEKIIQVTTDALFNLPAFLTSQLWSKKAKTYLYSFEHATKKSMAYNFLEGLPIAKGNATHSGNGLSHGDDLIYLFEVHTLEGQPLSNTQLVDAKDIKVRDHFTTLVAEFVKSGIPKVSTSGGQSWKPFTNDTGSYLVLSEMPHVADGFRNCQMALWAGIKETLQSAECSALGVGDLIGGLVGVGGGLLGGGNNSAVGGLVTNVNELTGGLGLNKGQDKGGQGSIVGGLGGLLHNRKSETTTHRSTTQGADVTSPRRTSPRPTKRPGLLGVGDLLG